MKKTFLSIILFGCMSVMAQEQVNVTYKTVKDIVYSTEQDAYAQERCKLDIYYPENLKECPTVVWFHGGGLTSGNKSIPSKLMNSGMIVIAANYRLIPKVSIDICLDDAAAAVAWAFREVAKYGGDPRKIFISGHSAGGYLTSMLGLDKKWLVGYDINADSIAGLIPFSGQAITHFAHRNSKGISSTRPVVDEFAPLYHVRPDAPPLIIISGDRELELFGRYEETAYFWRMMKLVGHKETYIYEIGGHDHGDMGGPACHILKNHVANISQGKNKR